MGAVAPARGRPRAVTSLSLKHAGGAGTAGGAGRAEGPFAKPQPRPPVNSHLEPSVGRRGGAWRPRSSSGPGHTPRPALNGVLCGRPRRPPRLGGWPTSGPLRSGRGVTTLFSYSAPPSAHQAPLGPQECRDSRCVVAAGRLRPEPASVPGPRVGRDGGQRRGPPTLLGFLLRLLPPSTLLIP